MKFSHTFRTEVSSVRARRINRRVNFVMFPAFEGIHEQISCNFWSGYFSPSTEITVSIGLKTDFDVYYSFIRNMISLIHYVDPILDVYKLYCHATVWQSRSLHIIYVQTNTVGVFIEYPIYIHLLLTILL